MYIEFTLSQAENYGTPEKPYWKQKGADYQLLPIDENVLYAADNRARHLADLVERVSDKLEVRNEYFEQSIVDWDLVDDEHYTEHELNQLEYDGAITYWATLLDPLTS